MVNKRYYSKCDLPQAWNTYRGGVRDDGEILDRGQITKGLLILGRGIWTPRRSSQFLTIQAGNVYDQV